MKSANQVALIASARSQFHQELLAGPLYLVGKVPSIADKDSDKSVRISAGMVKAMGTPRSVKSKQAGQTSGDEFESLVLKFIERTFSSLAHLRPGQWRILDNPGSISQFEQYQHLEELLQLVKKNSAARASLGGDYLIRPDLIIVRDPEPDETLNTKGQAIVSDEFPAHSPLRLKNNNRAILHASISCKWTIRSDRSQNTRTEALNLMRNRKGTVPHAVAVVAEPLPSRIGSIAYGTGDLDCIYHIALPELVASCKSLGEHDELMVLIAGRRLRDIADLPLDLAT